LFEIISFMILSDRKIFESIENKSIVIEPFSQKNLGSNSYDVHLAETLAIYLDDKIDAKKTNKIKYFSIPPNGYLLDPMEFYLGVTQEYTETHAHVPFLEGKSSIGRLGINIHATAGKGDVGFCNTWTLEISVRKPVRVYSGMPIGQLIFFEISGDVCTPYHKKLSAKYNQRTHLPIESMMWKNFPKNKT